MDQDACQEEGFPWLYTAVDLFTQCVMFMALIATFGTTILETRPNAPTKAEAPREQPKPKASAASDRDSRQVRDRQLLEKMMTQDPLGKSLSLRRDKGRLALSLKDRIFFESGSADLKPQAQATIARLAAVLKPMDCQLWVAGYTDDVPIKNARYSSNWVLATARAITVLKILQGASIASKRLAAAGYGKYHPRYPNNSSKNRAANRRVEISLVYR